MMVTIRRLALLLASSALLISCGTADEGADQPTTDPPVAEETTVDPSPEPPDSPSGSPAPRDVERAVADLAATLLVDPAEVEVVSVEEVTWRDGSRGCAQPGMAYTQALIEGSRITLRAGGKTYEYHAGGSRPPERCAKPTQ